MLNGARNDVTIDVRNYVTSDVDDTIVMELCMGLFGKGDRHSWHDICETIRGSRPLGARSLCCMTITDHCKA